MGCCWANVLTEVFFVWHCSDLRGSLWFLHMLSCYSSYYETQVHDVTASMTPGLPAFLYLFPSSFPLFLLLFPFFFSSFTSFFPLILPSLMSSSVFSSLPPPPPSFSFFLGIWQKWLHFDSDSFHKISLFILQTIYSTAVETETKAEKQLSTSCSFLAREQQISTFSGCCSLFHQCTTHILCHFSSFHSTYFGIHTSAQHVVLTAQRDDHYRGWIMSSIKMLMF